MKLIELDLLLELAYMDSWLNWNLFIIDKLINGIGLLLTNELMELNCWMEQIEELLNYI